MYMGTGTAGRVFRSGIRAVRPAAGRTYEEGILRVRPVLVLAVVVSLLHEDTLVAIQNTAPQRFRSCPAPPAAILLLFLATLTLAARSYALVQFTPNALLSPIDDSTSRTRTSTLVLSRFSGGPSDTSVIIADYKEILFYRKFRTKRGFEGSRGGYNRIGTDKPRADLLVEITTRENSSDSDSGESVANTDQFDKGEGGGRLDEVVESSVRPMTPGHAQDDTASGGTRCCHTVAGVATSGNEWGLVLVVVVLTGAALGLVTCLLSHQGVAGGVSGPRRGTPATDPHHAATLTPTSAHMLSVVSAGAAAGMGGMDRLRGGSRGVAARELAASRDRQVRLHAVHTDIAINLPPSIEMPDGEEHPFTSARLHIRDPEQESEIYQKCIRPPPNRTVLESESPPPYRSSSAGVLASSSSSSSGSDWSAGSAPLVVRCHSMSSTSKPSHHPHPGQKTDFLQRTVKIFTGGKKTTQQPPPPPAPTLPVVIVPSTQRPRRTAHQNSSTMEHNRPRPV